jgi:hypothetical protein
MDDLDAAGAAATATIPADAPDSPGTPAGQPATDQPTSGRPWWAFPAVIAAVIAVAVAAVWGVRGLFGDPVKGTDAQGITTIQGSWEPYSCGSPCIGYIQAGGRSVTVILREGCQEPGRDSGVVVHGRLDASQGKATYDAIDCPSPS